MSRDHKIRILVSRMNPEARAIAVEAFCRNPDLIEEAFRKRMGVARAKQKKHMTFTMRLSGEEYGRLQSLASADGKSMTDFAKGRIGL